MRAWLGEHRWAVGYGVAAAIVVGLVTYDVAVTLVGARSLGSDYWEHAAAIGRLLADPGSPDNPHLHSTAGSPRYMPHYVLAGTVGRALGLDAVQTMAAVAWLNVSLYLLGIYWFFRIYFDSPRAPLLALTTLLCGWGAGWHYASVYQLDVLLSVAAYPATAALALTWFALAVFVRGLGAPHALRWPVVGALLTAYVLLVHPLTAAMTVFALGALIATERAASARARWQLAAAITAGVALTAAWPYFDLFELLAGGHTHTGWMSDAASGEARAASGRSHAFYDLRALAGAVGPGALGLVVAVALGIRRIHLFVPLTAGFALGVFLLNRLIAIPLGHRFILLAMVPAHIALVWGWLRISGRGCDRRWPAIVAAACTAALVIHTGVRTARRLGGPGAGSNGSVLAYARATAELAGPDSVIMAPASLAWSVCSFGPRTVALHHPNPFVPDAAARAAAVSQFLSENTPARLRTLLADRYGVTHAIVPANRYRAARRYLRTWGPPRRLLGGRLLLFAREPRPPTL